ncbi:unnamed protein product, partial [Vitis vinifera]|uniref:Uncharacterized protein n=1 Tax=Vitis vinifera TaxID=29760 RepID=D7U8P8_VITVI
MCVALQQIQTQTQLTWVLLKNLCLWIHQFMG